MLLLIILYERFMVLTTIFESRCSVVFFSKLTFFYDYDRQGTLGRKSQKVDQERRGHNVGHVVPAAYATYGVTMS